MIFINEYVASTTKIFILIIFALVAVYIVSFKVIFHGFVSHVSNRVVYDRL